MAERKPSKLGCDPQEEVIAFLSEVRSYGEAADAADSVDIHETHGAMVFLVGSEAYKLKRAVRFDYMDFSTIDKRRRALLREIEINRAHAPELYRDVVAIMRAPNGTLSIGGQGVPVDYVLRMRRFSQQNLLSRSIERAPLSRETCARLGDAIFAAHCRCPISGVGGDGSRLVHTIDALAHGLGSVAHFDGLGGAAVFERRARLQYERAKALCEARAIAGFVRRCHGDLHLNNIVLQGGEPRLFDALEFDEDLATIDTLYDLAFLLMDLDHNGHRREANFILNRYLWRSQAILDFDGLVAMPLFLGLRSAIRALTTAQRASQEAAEKASADIAIALGYFEAALRYLEPASPRLIAIGGFSGTGKSTVAGAISPFLDPAPGAIHLRTDLERKSLFGVGEFDRLPAAGYALEATRRTYARVLEKAAAILKAGHSVIVDAAFQLPQDRSAIEDVARHAGVMFDGLWLSAPRETLLARVAARTGDASDATPDVVEMQLSAAIDSVSWQHVDAGGSVTQSISRACAVLGLSDGDLQ